MTALLLYLAKKYPMGVLSSENYELETHQQAETQRRFMTIEETAEAIIKEYNESN